MSKVFFVGVLVLCLAGTAGAQTHGFGVGPMVGEPTGLNAKFWMPDSTALVGALAWSFADNADVHVHFDYLRHAYGMLSIGAAEMPLHYGVGGRLKFGNLNSAGIRLVGGLSHRVPNQPTEIFFDVAPVVDVAPAIKLKFNVSVGLRIYLR